MREYLKLLKLDYNDAVDFLLTKYSGATDDYYKEHSYEKFLDGVIKTPSKGKISRSNEGLYCHHIDENKYENISDAKFILHQNIPFKMQRKDRLVYCDLVEHAILHAIIAKETDWKYGKRGLDIFLVPQLAEWYLYKEVPKEGWRLNCYEKSFIDEINAEILLEVLGEKIFEGAMAIEE